MTANFQRNTILSRDESEESNTASSWIADESSQSRRNDDESKGSIGWNETSFAEKHEERPGACVSKTRDELDVAPKDMKQRNSRETIRVFSRLLPNIQMVDGKAEIDLSDYCKENGCEIEVVAVDEGRFLDSVLFDSGSEDDRVSLMVQQQALDPSKNYTEEKRISIGTAVD